MYRNYMKLRYLFAIILSAALALTGCQVEQPESFDNISLDKSYVAIPVGGGATEITISATEAWSFQDVDKIPSWLTVSPTSGSAGATKVSFSASSIEGGREVELSILAGKNTQFVKVRQGSMEAASATCADVIAGPDGKTFKVKGVCTNIVNTTYGNWYLQDETGEIYIYGTLDAKGATKNFLSLGLEVGDIVEVQGPKTTYGSTIELVDVTVLSITKSLVKVESAAAELPKEGGEFEVKVTYKGEGVLVSIPEESNWINLVSMNYVPGEATKINPNPSDTVVVKFNAQPNTVGDRSGSVVFESKSGKTGSAVTYNVAQKGAIIDADAATINAAEDGATQYRITGYITKVANTTYGNFYLKDATGEVYVYGTLDANGQTKQWANMGIKEGDIVTVVGPKSSYKGSPQMVNVSVEKHTPVTDVTVSEFLAKSDNSSVYYRIKGNVANIKNTTYGNFDIVDETGSVYVYGLTNGWGGPSKAFESFGINEGDNLTLIGVRSSYKGTAQVGSAFYVAHTPAN